MSVVISMILSIFGKIPISTTIIGIGFIGFFAHDWFEDRRYNDEIYGLSNQIAELSGFNIVFEDENQIIATRLNVQVKDNDNLQKMIDEKDENLANVIRRNRNEVQSLTNVVLTLRDSVSTLNGKLESSGTIIVVTDTITHEVITGYRVSFSSVGTPIKYSGFTTWFSEDNTEAFVNTWVDSLVINTTIERQKSGWSASSVSISPNIFDIKSFNVITIDNTKKVSRKKWFLYGILVGVIGNEIIKRN